MSDGVDGAVSGNAEDPRRFAALRDRDSGLYIGGSAVTMMADNIEHVLGYWVLWQTFHSPWLVGFQIVSHWLPFLLFSVYAGSLAERFDCRRLIQIAQGLFMLVSLLWGVLFLTGTLELWHACVLLVLHGIAGCLWHAAEKMMLYHFAGPSRLTSTVRMNATFQSLAFIAGPMIGSALLLLVGPAFGMLINVLFYLPLTLFLARTKFTGHSRAAASADPSGAAPQERTTFLSTFRVLGTVRKNPLLLGMILLAGLSAICIGPVLQNAMPDFADRLGAGSSGLAYGVLLLAHGAGGVIGGFLLEATRAVPATGATAIGSAIVTGVSVVVFAASGNYLVALIALVAAGFAGIASASTEMSIVQLEAPEAERGRVIGAYSMFGFGMMTFSGVTVAVLGSLFGLPGSVLVGGSALVIGAVVIGAYMFWPRRSAA